ncbi:MAG: YhfC family glutamic-type intramembrane protease [Sandaracinus sp.]
MVELATLAQVLIEIGVPIALARAVRARRPVGWRALFVGVLAFVLSQVGHLPFNALVGPLLPAPPSPWAVPVASVFLGLSAGVFEELARYAAMRWALAKQQTGPHALAYGIGHGGVESAILGVLAATTLLNVLLIERVGPAALGIPAAQIPTVEQGLREFHEGGALPHLLAALERICAISFHVAASTLVMRAVVEKRARWLIFAIGYHAITDGMLLPLQRSFGTEITEVFILGTVPVSLLVLAWTVRALPALPVPPREARPAASGAPIELVRADKRYGEVHALRAASFTLREGERACLLGPNGAGKTTTIRLITGAVAPSSGFAFVLGHTADEDAFLACKGRMGIVPQQPGMYEHLTVRQYLALVRELYGRGDAPEVAAARLGLEDALDRATSALSGGMQRRLALAAALAPHPDVLVLDEPSAGLDPVASRQMIAAVREASQGRTTLLCTHNLAEAEELCDSVVILRGGEVVLHASIDELRKKTLARIALRAQGASEALALALRSLGHETEAGDEGEVLVPALDAERAAPALLRALLAAGVDVYECRVVKPSLEDLFFQAVSGGASEPRSVSPAAREVSP